MLNCSGCGAVNSDDAIKCATCGRALQITCSVCGCNNSVTAAVCNQCGKDLENNSKTKGEETKLTDPVNEMFEPQVVVKTQSSTFPKKAIIFLVLGLFIFALLYLSKICEGHPYILLFGGLISGIVALVGLIELTFWFIDEKNLVDSDLGSDDKLENDLPEVHALDAETPVASFEESDRDLEKSSKASEKDKISSLEMGTPIEAVPEQVVKSPSVDKHYDTLAEFLDDGITTEINEIKEKLEKTPNNYALMLRLAQLFDERGETENALNKLEECIKHNPDSAEVYLYYGTMLRQNGKLDEAQEAFEKALSKNKVMAKAYYQLGLLEKTRGNSEQAKELFQKAIQLSPDDPYAH